MPLLRLEDKLILSCSECQVLSCWTSRLVGTLMGCRVYMCHISHLVNVGSANFTPRPTSPSAPLGTASKLGYREVDSSFFFFLLELVFCGRWHYHKAQHQNFFLTSSSHLMSPSVVQDSLSFCLVCVLDLVARLASTDAKGGNPGGN